MVFLFIGLVSIGQAKNEKIVLMSGLIEAIMQMAEYYLM